MEIRALTGMRGVAAWVVVFYHLKEAMPGDVGQVLGRWFGWGYLAVDVFFVLSGFVICINYSNFSECFSLSGFSRFMGRRLARVYPLHFVVLILYLLNPLAIILFSQSKVLGDRYDFGYYIESLLLIQNWGINDVLAWNVPAWSISVELLAYAAFPVFLAGSLLIVSFFGLLGIVFLFFLLLSLQFLVWFGIGASSIGEHISTLGWFRCIVQFAMGVLLGVLYVKGLVVLRFAFISLVILIVLAVVGVVAFGLPDYYWMPLVSVGLIQYLAVASCGVSMVLGSSVVYGLGLISYSTYLVHYLIRDWFMFMDMTSGWVDFSVYCAVLLIFSIVLYRVVEMPGRAIFMRFWGRLF